MSITAAKGSYNLNRDKHEIFHVGPREQASKGSIKAFPLAPPLKTSSDNLELSPSAKNLLKNVAQHTHQLMKDYPQYEDLFLDKKGGTKSSGIPQALSFLNRVKTFLSDPYFQNLASHDEGFASFYSHVKNIGMHNNEALKKVQHEMRSSETTTYHSLIK